MKISNCCSASLIGETDLCSQCKEHCEGINDNMFTSDDLIPNGMYRVKDKLIISGHDGDAVVTFPDGYVIIFEKYQFESNFWWFRTEDGIQMELWDVPSSMMESLEFIKVKQRTREQMRTYEGYVTELKDNEVFVFGSNLDGFHGAGSAGFASFGEAGNVWRKHDFANKPTGWKGKWNVKGIGKGYQEGTEGRSYGLATVHSLGKNGYNLSKEEITANIKELYDYADANPKQDFLIAYCNDGSILLNGYKIEEMAEMFESFPIPCNIIFEERFSKLFEGNEG